MAMSSGDRPKSYGTLFAARGRGISVFVLELQGGTYLVGQTRLKQFTFKDILQSSINPLATNWLTIHRPIKVYAVYYDCTLFDEDKYVKSYMLHYGMDNVRGGSYPMTILDPLLRRLLEHELAYVQWLKQPQAVARMSSSLLSSQLGMNESMTDSILANSLLDTKEKPLTASESESQPISSWIYDQYSTAYDLVCELGKYLWPWNSGSHHTDSKAETITQSIR